MNYKLTVNVTDDRFCGVFNFDCIEKAVEKIRNTLYVGMTPSEVVN